jgi:predicted kinase
MKPIARIVSNCCGARPDGELCFSQDADLNDIGTFSGRCSKCKEGAIFTVDTTPDMPAWPSVIFVAIGPPACGKSVFPSLPTFHEIRQFVGAMNVIDDDGRPVIISSDAIRKELTGNPLDQSVNEATFAEVRRRLAEAASSACGRDIYVDATHAEKSWRKYIFDVAERYGAEVYAIYFKVPFLTLVWRDLTRKNRVGIRVLWKYVRRMERPTFAEGFTDMYIIDEHGTVVG